MKLAKGHEIKSAEQTSKGKVTYEHSEENFGCSYDMLFVWCQYDRLGIMFGIKFDMTRKIPFDIYEAH